jgi:cysteine synthase B
MNQYNNPANWRRTTLTTGPEIWRQTGGAVTHFVAGLGTTGTFMGVGRYLKERNPDIELVAVQPEDELAVIEGLKHLESAIVPGIYDAGLPDRFLRRGGGGPPAGRSTRRAGAAVAAAIELAHTLRAGRHGSARRRQQVCEFGHFCVSCVGT